MSEFEEVLPAHIPLTNNIKCHINKTTKQCMIFIPVSRLKALDINPETSKKSRVGVFRKKSKVLIKKSSSCLRGYKLSASANYVAVTLVLNSFDKSIISNFPSKITELSTKKYKDGVLFDFTDVISQSTEQRQ